MSTRTHRMSLVAAAVGFFVAGCLGISNEAYMVDTATFIAQPSPDMALVKFHRLGGSGVAQMTAIWDREVAVGHSTMGTSIVYECEPGEHLFIAICGDVSMMKATLEAGKAYDVVLEVKTGMTRPRPSLYPVSPSNNFSKMRGVMDRMRQISANPVSMAGYTEANLPAVQNMIERFDGGRWVGLVNELLPTDARP